MQSVGTRRLLTDKPSGQMLGAVDVLKGDRPILVEIHPIDGGVVVAVVDAGVGQSVGQGLE